VYDPDLRVSEPYLDVLGSTGNRLGSNSQCLSSFEGWQGL
jgi:hypothetical protein